MHHGWNLDRNLLNSTESVEANFEGFVRDVPAGIGCWNLVVYILLATAMDDQMGNPGCSRRKKFYTIKLGGSPTNRDTNAICWI